MFSPTSAEDLRAMLLHMAAAGSAAPEGRVRIARWLRAALALVEDEELARAHVARGVSPAQVAALEEIAQSLEMAAHHAEFLADQARRGCAV